MNESGPVTRHCVCSHATRRGIIKAEVPKHHPGSDGLEVRWLIRSGCKLRHTAPRPAVHSDISIRPWLLRGKFDRVSPVFAVFNSEKIKRRSLRAAGCTRTDTHHRVAASHERPV